jgi:hypothetical protein
MRVAWRQHETALLSIAYRVTSELQWAFAFAFVQTEEKKKRG